MQHARDYGLSADNVGFDAKAVVQRSRGVSKRLNDGVGFLMKKNKVTVIWGEASIDAPGRITVRKSAAEAPKGALGGGAYQAQHIILATGARPRVLPGLEPRQEADLDLFRGNGAGENAEIAAGGGFGRHGRRVRVVLPHPGRRGDRGRGVARKFCRWRTPKSPV